MTVLLIIVLLIVLALVGCVEEQQTPPVWGRGSLPTDWQNVFGNDNGSRLDYWQNQAIGELAKKVQVLEAGRRTVKEED